MLLRPAALVLALAASALAWGEGHEMSDRLAWLTYVEGEIEFQGAGERRTTDLPNRPLVSGDRLTTRNDSRAEVSLGTAVIRLDENTGLSITDLEAKSVRLALSGNKAIVHLFELLEGERFELVTPTSTIALDTVGEYRVDFVTESAITLSVRSGAATVPTSGGPIQVLAGQRVHLEGRGERAILMSARSRDDFDDWVLEREVQLAGLEPSPDSEANGYGEWSMAPDYGRVWVSDYAYEDRWNSYGAWISSGFGWAWIGSAPCCGSIYGGRWVYVDHVGRWCWVPPRPVQWPRVASVTHPYGRTSVGTRRESGLPRTITLGGGGQTVRPGSTASWGSVTTTTARPSSGSTLSSSGSSGGAASSSRPMGSSRSSRSSSSSSVLSPGSVLTPR